MSGLMERCRSEEWKARAEAAEAGLLLALTERDHWRDRYYRTETYRLGG